MFLGKLQNLQNLRISNHSKSNKVPNVLWMMKRLRHIYFDGWWITSHFRRDIEGPDRVPRVLRCNSEGKGKGKRGWGNTWGMMRIDREKYANFIVNNPFLSRLQII